MQKFKSYESEYLEITKDIKTKIDGLSKLPKSTNDHNADS